MDLWEKDEVELEFPVDVVELRSTLVPPNDSSWNGSPDSTANASDVDRFLENFNDVLGVGITGIVCLIGVAGNVLTFIVLLRTFGRSPMFYVLRMLAVSDGLFLLSVFTTMTFVNMYHSTGLFATPYFYRGYVQFYVWPLLMTTQMTTVWLTVLVSCERYVAICHPLKAAYICTISKVRASVLTIVIGAVLFNIPRYLEYRAEYDDQMFKTAIGNDSVYRYLYCFVLYAMAVFFLPLLLLVVLNLLLVLALRRGKRQWRQLQFRQRHEQNLTVIPLTIVLVFFLCGTPSLLVNIADSVSPEVNFDVSFIAFMIVANFLVVINSASNIIIYFLLGRKFRSRVAEMLRCRCRYGSNNNYELTERPEVTTTTI